MRDANEARIVDKLRKAQGLLQMWKKRPDRFDEEGLLLLEIMRDLNVEVADLAAERFLAPSSGTSLSSWPVPWRDFRQGSGKQTSAIFLAPSSGTC
jgi:hypothetical protein